MISKTKPPHVCAAVLFYDRSVFLVLSVRIILLILSVLVVLFILTVLLILIVLLILFVVHIDMLLFLSERIFSYSPPTAMNMRYQKLILSNFLYQSTIFFAEKGRFIQI